MGCRVRKNTGCFLAKFFPFDFSHWFKLQNYTAEFRSQESGVEQALSLAFRLSCVLHQLENCCNFWFSLGASIILQLKIFSEADIPDTYLNTEAFSGLTFKGFQLNVVILNSRSDFLERFPRFRQQS